MPKNYYVLCDDDCKYTGMNEEQILTAIEEAVSQGYVSDPDSAVFSKIKEIRANETAQIWIGTEAQFNALSPAPDVGYTFVRIGADGIMYICTDDVTSETLLTHAVDKSNPHEVTADQAGAAEKVHAHGNMSSDGKVGTESGKVLTTGSGGAVQASAPDSVCALIGAQKQVTASTTDLTAGTSALATGEVYVVYE